MDFNRTYYVNNETSNPKWRVLDADGKVLGRLATQIADALRGKDKATYTPHNDAGDYVVVVNADKIKLTANKMDTKIYTSYSGWIGGRKDQTARQIFQKDPTRLITMAVEGMMPKSRLSRSMLGKLKVYVGTEHPHKAQFMAGTAKKAKAEKATAKKAAAKKKVAAE